MALPSMVDEVAARISARAFLYDDPASFRAGVEESHAALRRALTGAPLVAGFDMLAEEPGDRTAR